jgi:hypothetical protein
MRLGRLNGMIKTREKRIIYSWKKYDIRFFLSSEL